MASEIFPCVLERLRVQPWLTMAVVFGEQVVKALSHMDSASSTPVLVSFLLNVISGISVLKWVLWFDVSSINLSCVALFFSRCPPPQQVEML